MSRNDGRAPLTRVCLTEMDSLSNNDKGLEG
jgi:hypothetical protein